MVLARRQESVDALAMGRCLQLPDSPPAAPIAATLDPACLDDAELIFVAGACGGQSGQFYDDCRASEKSPASGG
jgi:hypothetical protein